MATALESTRQEHVALSLSNAYLEQLKKDEKYASLVPLLTQARDTVWPDVLPGNNNYALDARERQEKVKKIIAAIPKDGADENNIAFMEAFAKLGHLYEMGGQLARSNFFGNLIDLGKNIPHGAADFINPFPTAAQAVEALNKPVFEATFTSHPTNNNTLELMNALREVGKAATALRGRPSRKNQEKYDEAIQAFAEAPLVPVNGKKPFNISTSGETKEMLNFLGNAYEDLGAAYRHFDRALEKKPDYDPLSLHLNLRFNSWGSSGDKDGNKKVNADTALEAAYMHTIKIAQLVCADIGQLKTSELNPWKEKLDQAAKDLMEARQEIKRYRKSSEPLPQNLFDRLSARLGELTPDMNAVKEAAITAYKTYPRNGNEKDEEKKRPLLMLARKIEVFGAHMGSIEYRETSEEFTRIIDLVLKGQRPPIDYAAMNEEQKVATLTRLIEQGRAPELLAKMRAQIDEEGFGHNFDADPYRKDEAIAYHTIKRLELARDHPDLIANQVLAECQGLSNKLEVKFLMEGLAKDGKKPVLGIIPLYEDPQVMQKVGEIEAASYANPAYRKHLEEFAQAHPEETKGGKSTQQVQFAHSDNRRRGGPAAAVGFIDQGHRAFRAAAQRAGIEAQCYEGGSQSDPFRNGTRSISAMTNEFRLHDHAKMTFQGGDLHNYFGVSSSFERLVTRALSHGAKCYDRAKPVSDITKDPINYLAIKALEATLSDYEHNIFQTDKIGVVLASVGFGQQEMNGGNIGTRGARKPELVFPKEGAEVNIGRFIKDSSQQEESIGKTGGRRKMVFKTVKSVQMGAANPDAMRTISYAELLEHAGAYPTWLGTRTIEENVQKFSGDALELLTAKAATAEGLSKDEREMQVLLMRSKKGASDEHAGAPSPQLLQKLYAASPAFREVIDRMAFGIAMSNLDTLETLQPQLKGTEIMEQMKAEYVTAGRLVLKAMDGIDKSVSRRVNTDDTTPTAAIQKAVSSHLSHLKPNIERKRNYMEFVNYFKRSWKDDHPDGSEVPTHLLRVCHAAIDTVTHARTLMADDPAYAAAVIGRQLAGQGMNGNGRNGNHR